MYRFTTTDGTDRTHSSAPDAVDELFTHLREQLVDADGPRQIDWTLHGPDQIICEGTCGTAGPGDRYLEANLDGLHHAIASDLAFELYEATRLSAPDATISE